MERSGLKQRLVRAAVLGWLAGGAAASLPMWTEALRRLRFALGGGAGETALWGGPAFFAALRTVLPSEWTLAGAAVAALLVVLWPARRGTARERR